MRIPAWAPRHERLAYLDATYPEGDYPARAYSSTGCVRDKSGYRATESCICGAKFEGSRQDAEDFAEAHKHHEPDRCECCGAEL